MESLQFIETESESEFKPTPFQADVLKRITLLAKYLNNPNIFIELPMQPILPRTTREEMTKLWTDAIKEELNGISVLVTSDAFLAQDALNDMIWQVSQVSLIGE
jgi:hypothetical protein